MDDPTGNNNDREEESSSMPPLNNNNNNNNNNNDGVSMNNNNNSNNNASSRDVHHETSSVNNDNNISNNHMQQHHRHQPSSSANFATSSSSSPNNTRPKSSNQLGARQSISMTYQNNNNNLQQHPNLPFLVTHWLSQYAPPPSSSEFAALGGMNNTTNSNNNDKREEALQLIRQQATQLAKAFQTLGAFGQSSSLPASSTNNNVNSNSGSGSGIGSDQLALLHGFSSSRPTTYADLSRKYSNLLSINNGIKSNNNDTEGRRGTTLLDALIQHAGVSSSSALLSTNNTMKHHVLPWSLLVAAYEGCVPTEEESRGLLATTAASDTTNEKNASSMSHSGRKSGKFYGTGRKVGGGEDYLISSSGNTIPLFDKERCDNSSIHAAHASRHQLSLRMEAIHQRKEMEGTNLTLQQSMKKQQVATSRRSEIDMLEGSDSELNNLRRIVAQLEVRTKELNSKYELTKVKIREAKMETKESYSNWTCIQRQYDDACKLNGEYPSSSLHRKVLRLGISNDARRRNLGYGALAHAPGKNNIGLSAILSRQYHNNSGGGGHHVVSSPTTSSETTLSVLKSRLSHAVTISSHLIYPVYCLKFDKTGRYFITGSDDQTAKVFHVGGGESHAGTLASSSSFNYGANARGAVLVCTLNGHAGVVTDIDVSADNALLATSSMDGDVRVWRLRDGCPVAILRGHKDGANMVRESRQMLACFMHFEVGFMPLCL